MRAARPAPASAASRTGSALRSSFPFAVSGSSPSTTNPDGTMYSGSRCPSHSRNAAEPIPASPAAAAVAGTT